MQSSSSEHKASSNASEMDVNKQKIKEQKICLANEIILMLGFTYIGDRSERELNYEKQREFFEKHKTRLFQLFPIKQTTDGPTKLFAYYMYIIYDTFYIFLDISEHNYKTCSLKPVRFKI